MAASFDRVARVYDRTRGLPSGDVIEAITDEIPNRAAVLDAGVGTGRFAKLLLRRGLRVVGVDISNKMLLYAKEKGIKELVMGDVRQLPFRDKSFDCTLLIHMLHLIREWRAVLAETRRVTKRKLLSIISMFEPKSRSPRHLYIDMVTSHGIRLDSTIEGVEAELQRFIKPRKLTIISDHHGRRNLNEVLKVLEKRKTSITWGVPEKLHRSIMDELKRKFYDKLEMFHYKTYLVCWDVADIADETLSSVKPTY